MSLIIKHTSGVLDNSSADFRFANMADSATDAQEVSSADTVSGTKSAFTNLPGDTQPADTAWAVADPLDPQQEYESQLNTLRQVFSKSTEELLRCQQRRQAESEQHVLQLAVAIAERIVRGQLDRQPDISLRWIRESIELLSNSRQLRIHLNPQDQHSLGAETEKLAAQIARVASVEIVADASVSPGGCRVESDQGLVDQAVESQLQRVLEELDCTVGG